MNSGWSRLADRLRRQGPGWVVRRLRFEARTPTTGPGKLWLALRLRLRSAWLELRRRLGGADAAARGDTLYAFYDLEVAPITYDVVWFAAWAEQRRRALGIERIEFLVVPGRQDGVRREDPHYETVVGEQARRRRVHDIILPVFAMLPSAAGARMLASREEADRLRRGARHVCPAHYHVGLPTVHHSRDVLAAARAGIGPHCLRAPGAARARVAAWVRENAGGRRLVAITLRQYGYHAVRNSDLEAWAAFARGLDAEEYAVCVVPDTATASQPLPQAFKGCLYFPEGALDVTLRMALYEAAFINLGINSGPLYLCLFAERQPPCLMFGMLDNRAPQTSERYMRSLGFTPGDQPAMLGPHQRWVWGPDSHESIVAEFRAMAVKLPPTRD